MTIRRTTIRAAAVFLAAAVAVSAAPGCNKSSSSETPKEFTPLPDSPPTGGVPGDKGNSKKAKDRGPADKVGDG